MKYQPTILNLSTAVFLLGILAFTIWNYDTLASNGGWGIVAMFGLVGIGIIAGIVDLILQQFIKNKKVLNIVGLVIIVGLAVSML